MATTPATTRIQKNGRVVALHIGTQADGFMAELPILKDMRQLSDEPPHTFTERL